MINKNGFMIFNPIWFVYLLAAVGLYFLMDILIKWIKGVLGA
jgi:hypothetical protein